MNKFLDLGEVAGCGNIVFLFEVSSLHDQMTCAYA